MTTYRTSVQESTGYVPHFLVYAPELCHPIDFMYPNPNDHLSSSTNEFASAGILDFQEPTNQSIQLSIKDNRGATRCIIEKFMNPSTKKNKRYYSTGQLYKLVNFQSFFVRGRPIRHHTGHQRCHLSYRRSLTN